MFVRSEYQTLLARMQEPRGYMQVIMGPRQVGKSTMVAQVLEAVQQPFLSFSAEEAPNRDPKWISSVWMQARQLMRLHNYDEMILAIDEIHKLPNWSEFVKAEYDRDTRESTKIKVILLGSSRLMLMDGLTESLAGRFEVIEMGHWSFLEMKEAFGFNLEQYIYYGGYPGGARFVNNESRWRQYIKESIIEPAISQDVLLTKRIYKPALLRQLFDLGCTYSGTLLSNNKIMGMLQDAGNSDTITTYLRVLNESRMLGGLRKYAADEARKYMSVPKYQVWNNALLSAQKGSKFANVFTNSELWGHWVESAIGAWLVSGSREYEYDVYYWRDKSEEVDFIVQMSDMVIAIEVKSGRRKTNSGIYTFENKFHPTHSIIVGTGGIPISDLLSHNITEFFA